MFTGIVEGVGDIQAINGNNFSFSHPFKEIFAVGDSVACNGCCLTVLKSTPKDFTAEIIAESRRLTVFGNSQLGDLVNLERSALIGARNSGHNVTGHIDQVGPLLKLERQGDYWLIRIEVLPKNRKLLVLKGSVALNGISLTVSGVSAVELSGQPSSSPFQQERSYKEAWFEVSIINHTWEVTNLKKLALGSMVNVEFDVLGKYYLPKNNAFFVWNTLKQNLDQKKQSFMFKERDVLFIKVGKNIGYEQDGRGTYFLRPVVIVRKFNKNLFWGVPLTTKMPKKPDFYHEISPIKGKRNWAILSQGRTFDAKRVQHKLSTISKSEILKLQQKLQHILFKLEPSQKIKPPQPKIEGDDPEGI